MVPTSIPKPEQLDFMHIRVKVGNKVVSGDLSEDLKIPEDPEELVLAMSRQPSMYFYWASTAEVARVEFEQAKRRWELWYSEKYLVCKKQLTEEFGKSYVTDTMVKSSVYDNFRDEYDAKQEDVLRAEYRKNVLALATKAFLERGNSMINILSWKKADRHEVGRMGG